MVFGEDNKFIVNTSVIENRIVPMLEKAEENNVLIALMPACHLVAPVMNDTYNDFNIYHEKHIEAMEKYLETLISLTSSYQALDSIVISNEMTANTASIPALLPDWQKWLSVRYGEIGKLSDTYSVSYADFSNVPFPSEATEIKEGYNYPIGSETIQFYDWMMYNNEKLGMWHKHLAEKIKEACPDMKVHVKMQDYFDYNAHTEFARYRMTWGTEAENYADFSDYMGNDSHSSISWIGRSMEGKMKWYDYLSSVKNVPVVNSEDHMISDYSTNYNPKKADFVYSDIFQGAIHGRTASVIWAWEQTADSDSVYSGIIMQRPDVLTSVGRAVLDLNRLADEITALNKADADIAIMLSNLERVYNPEHLTVLDRVYRSSVYSGHKVDFVTDTYLEKIKNYDMLIIPMVTHISDLNLEMIEEYNNNGNKVILVGDCFTHNEIGLKREFSEEGYVVAEKITETEDLTNLSDLICNISDRQGVRVCNSSEELVNGIEWSWTAVNGRILINGCNYSEKDISDMKPLVNGENVSAVELISGNNISGSFTAVGYKPMLFEISNVEYIKSCEYSNGKIRLEIHNPKNTFADIDIAVLWYNDDIKRYSGRLCGRLKANETIDFKVTKGEKDCDRFEVLVYEGINKTVLADKKEGRIGEN